MTPLEIFAAAFVPSAVVAFIVSDAVCRRRPRPHVFLAPPEPARLVTDRHLVQAAQQFRRAGAVPPDADAWTEDWIEGLARDGYDQEQILAIAAGGFLRTLELAREHRLRAQQGVSAVFWGDGP